MLPNIMRSVIARGGRSAATRRNFSTSPKPGDVPKLPEGKSPDSFARKLHKHFDLSFYTLCGFCVYAVSDTRDKLLDYERRVRAEKESRHDNLVKKLRELAS